MKKPMKMKLILLTIVVVLMISSLMAQSVIKDYNGTPVGYVGSSWLSQTIACTADTVWKKIVIPAGTYEILARPTANIMLAADSLYAAADNYEVTLQDTTAYVALPVHNMTTMWIRRASAGTAASLNMLFKKW